LAAKPTDKVTKIGSEKSAHGNPEISSHEVRPVLKTSTFVPAKLEEIVGVISREIGGSGELHRLTDYNDIVAESEIFRSCKAVWLVFTLYQEVRQ